MPTIAEVRAQYPQYNDMSDTDLADALHQKFYSDMPKQQFNFKIGLTPKQQETPQAPAYSGTILPLSKDQNGNVNFDSDAGLAGMAKRAIMGAYSGATAPGDALAGKFNVQPEEPGKWSEADQFRQNQADQDMLRRTRDLAGIATPMSAARTAGVGFMGAPISAQAAKVAAPTRDALEAAANQGYDAIRNSPFAVKASAVSDLSKGIQGDLEKDGLLGEFAPDTFTVLKKLQDPAGDAIATGGNLVSAREALRNASRNFTNPREAVAANRAISKLDQFIEAPPASSVLDGTAADFAKTASDARANYAAAKRSETVDDALRAADLQNAATNSGHNLDNATRQRFKSILLSDKKSSGFSDDELAQMEQVVRGSKLGDAARHVGNVLGGGGGLGMHISGATGGGAGLAAFGPIGMAVGAVAPPLIGAGLKKVADAATLRQAALFNEMIRQRSPLYQQMLANAPKQVPALRPSDQILARALMSSATPQQ